MSAALPSALRARFQECIKEGLSGRAAAARLKLSAATGVRWQRKLWETGSIEPAPQGRPPGHGKLSAHQAVLEELVARDGDITLPELAGALDAATVVSFVGYAAIYLDHDEVVSVLGTDAPDAASIEVFAKTVGINQLSRMRQSKPCR